MDRTLNLAPREVAILLRRIRVMTAPQAGIDTVRLAEAAYALQPSQDTRGWLAKALKDYAYSLRGDRLPRDVKVRILETHLREREITLEIYREHCRRYKARETRDVRLPSIEGADRSLVRAAADEADLEALIVELNHRDRELTNLLFEWYGAHFADCRAQSAWFELMSQQFKRLPLACLSVDEWAADIRHHLELCVNPPYPGVDRRRVVSTLALSQGVALGSLRLREWDREAIGAVWQWMIRHREPIVALAGCEAAVRWEGWTGNPEKRAELARSALDFFVNRLPLEHPDRVEGHDDGFAQLAFYIANGLSDPREKADWFRRLVTPWVERADGMRLLVWFGVAPCFRCKILENGMAVGEFHTLASRALAAIRAERIRLEAAKKTTWEEQVYCRCARECELRMAEYLQAPGFSTTPLG